MFKALTGDGRRKSQLLKAASENQVQPVHRFLSDRGAPEDFRNDERQGLLQVAALHGAEDVLALLLQSSRMVNKINARDRSYRTALHLAAAMGFSTCVRRLLDAAAALELQDNEGCTALHLAVKFEWAETAQLLLERGADPLLEDARGQNAVDLAHTRQDTEVATLLAAYDGRRRTSSWQEMRRCIAPQWRQANGGRRAEAYAIGDEPPDGAQKGGRPNRNMDGVVAAPIGRQQDAKNAKGDGAEKSKLSSLLAEGLALQGRGQQDPDAQIEWRGLEPVLVPQRDGQEEASGMSGWLSSWRKPGQEGAAGQALPGQGLRPNAHKKAPPGTFASSAPLKRPEFVTFRIHAYFDERVTRLEFEVAWKETQPAVGFVKPGGAAETRGVAAGDRLVEINGVSTRGKGREELLPLLKTRPLLLKVEREERVRTTEEQRLELQLELGSGDAGMDVQQRGGIPFANAVRPKSAAWMAGVLEGDGIASVNGQDMTRASPSAVLAALRARPAALTVWRRPLGAGPGGPLGAQQGQAARSFAL